nr:uncharacterized protein LOC126543858 isoform X5 [Dermacentor andersoni]
MLIHALLVIYFFVSEVQCGKGSTQLMENSIVRDGWNFFARRLQFVMLKRTYNVTGGLNNSMCMMVPFPPKIDRMQHVLNATFTYRNLSSTYKLHPENTADNTSYWPIAIFQLHFYARNLKGGASLRKTGLDFVNPTTVMLAHQKRGPHKRQCELWISLSAREKKQENDNERKQIICEEFFRRWCDTRNLQSTYNPEICARKI